jgi:hypothetical protein
MIRAEAKAAFYRWREPIAAGLVGLFALWLMLLGGYLLLPLGAVVTVLACVWFVQALRRLRFGREIDAPGVVEIDEGQVGYLGPSFGGYVSLPEMVELRVIEVQGKRHWRLKQKDGQALIIPMAAAGSEQLFDAFASLPGMDTQALVSAVEAEIGAGVIWRNVPSGGKLRLAGT